MSVWAANCRFQEAFGAPRKPLVSIRQLLGTSRKSIPALRKPNGALRQRNLASRESIVALRKLKTVVFSSLKRGQGRAVGAAEDHMKCLELFGILKSFIEKGEDILTAALQHVSALPVQLLRQVSLQGSKMMQKTTCF